MDSNRWDRLQELFDAAVDLDAEERRRYLDEHCADDAELRREVDSLIRSAEGAEEAIGGAIRDVAGEIDGLPDPTGPGQPSPMIGRRIGPYRIEKRLGRGGMGTVYLAVRDDDQFRKQVAIKLMRGGADDREHLLRFKVERQILASLDHPNIARLIDGGTTEQGDPYVVMEYVEGQPIDEYCDRQRLTTGERLGLFQTVCDAVQYAHRNLVVHRDIKPGNIMVASDGTPKLLDFGIAKLLKPELSDGTVAVTRTQMRLLTPEYASPEQVRGEPITTASDVYSLGVLLYELLTGRRPHVLKTTSPRELERVICEEEPPRPSTALSLIEKPVTAKSISRARNSLPDKLRRQLSGDLDNIVMMALRKESSRRYGTVEQFAEDIRRYLDGLPVAARADTWTYRSSKFVRRHAVWVTVGAALVLLLAGFGVVMSVQAARIAAERDLAALERGKAEQVSSFLVELFQVSDPSEARGNQVTAREILDTGAARISRELDGQPEVQATLMATMGNVYRSLGLYADAEPLIERSLELRQSIFGERHLSVAEGLSNLANLEYELGRYEKAEDLIRRALAIREEQFGENHKLTALSLNDLGWLSYETGRYEESEALHRRALAIRRGLHDEEHIEVAESLNNLAAVLSEVGRQEEAEELSRDSLAMRRKLLGNDHPLTSYSANNLAVILEAQGKLDEAEELYRQSVAVDRSLGTPEEVHPSLPTSLINLGRLLGRKGEFDEAELVFREALALDQELRGPEHPYVAYDLRQLGELLHRKGDLVGAEVALSEALRIRRAGVSEPGMAPVLNAMGYLMLDRGDPRAAEAFVREGLEIWRRALPGDHHRIARTEVLLGSCLVAQGRFEEAEPMMLRGYEGLVAEYDADHGHVIRARGRLVELYESWGKPERAAAYRE